MTLEVKINGEIIGVVAVQRVTNLRVERLDPDEVNRYKVTAMMRNAPTQHHVIEHTYGDGAAVLAEKAFGVLSRPPVLI
jgi:hypothetical protein